MNLDAQRAAPWLGALALAGGCTGLTLDENQPGDDTFLENGAIAVEPVSETSLVLDAIYGGDGEVVEKRLFAVPPDAGDPEQIADLTGYSDSRILFPSGRVLLMAERGGTDELRALDPETFEELERVDTEARYHGTRMAPSRRYVAVADNAQDGLPIHVLDTETLEAREIPHGGHWLEAAWLNGSDRLLAISFHLGSQSEGEADDEPRARILSWDYEDVAASEFETDGDVWAEPELDLEIAGAQPDFLFSFTWIGVSPDDARAVFPIVSAAGEDGGREHRLAIVNLEEGTTRSVADARGPVGFTPDGSTIVSYRYVPAGEDERETRLVMIDAETLEEDEVPLPETNLPEYYVTPTGNFVVIANAAGGDELVLYDADTDQVTQLDGPEIAFREFVHRAEQAELWLVDECLHRLHPASESFEEVPVPWSPQHVNILRERDLLVLDDAESRDIRFVDPDTREVVRSVALPE